MSFSLDATLTTYYPINSGVEGGPNDCHHPKRPLITLQQHQSDPETYPYASVAGDCTAWPYGQRVSIPDIDPDAVFRIVDTGGHFHGAPCASDASPTPCKMIRNEGREPFDVCMDVGFSVGSARLSTVIVYPGDDFGEGGCSGACGNQGTIDFTNVVAYPVPLDDAGVGGKSLLVGGLLGTILAAGIVAALA